MNINEQVLTDIICHVINNKDINIPENVNWEYVFYISKAHNVCNIIYYGIEKLNIQMSAEIKENYEKEAGAAAMKEAAMSYICEKVLSEFEEKGVYAAPLKGYFLKELYPSSDMRTMCDADILIRPDKLSEAREIMEQMDFPVCEESEHEVVYKKPPFVSIELHKALLKKSTSEKLYLYYENIWSRLVPVRGKEYIKRMNNEDFYIYMIVHLAKHYLNGGAGLRNILDIYIFNRKCEINKTYVKTELEKLGLKKFCDTAEDLANYWFDSKTEMLPDTKIMSEYILRGGAYGNAAFAKAAYAIKTTGGNLNLAKYKNIVDMLFPRYENMIFLYPKLNGKRLLLPYYWLKRLVNKLSAKNRKADFNRSKVNKQNVETLKKHFNDLDLNL